MIGFIGCSCFLGCSCSLSVFGTTSGSNENCGTLGLFTYLVVVISYWTLYSLCVLLNSYTLRVCWNAVLIVYFEHNMQMEWQEMEVDTYIAYYTYFFCSCTFSIVPAHFTLKKSKFKDKITKDFKSGLK